MWGCVCGSTEGRNTATPLGRDNFTGIAFAGTPLFRQGESAPDSSFSSPSISLGMEFGRSFFEGQRPSSPGGQRRRFRSAYILDSNRLETQHVGCIPALMRWMIGPLWEESNLSLTTDPPGPPMCGLLICCEEIVLLRQKL